MLWSVLALERFWVEETENSVYPQLWESTRGAVMMACLWPLGFYFQCVLSPGKPYLETSHCGLRIENASRMAKWNQKSKTFSDIPILQLHNIWKFLKVTEWESSTSLFWNLGQEHYDFQGPYLWTCHRERVQGCGGEESRVKCYGQWPQHEPRCLSGDQHLRGGPHWDLHEL